MLAVDVAILAFFATLFVTLFIYWVIDAKCSRQMRVSERHALFE